MLAPSTHPDVLGARARAAIRAAAAMLRPGMTPPQAKAAALKCLASRGFALAEDSLHLCVRPRPVDGAGHFMLTLGPLRAGLPAEGPGLDEEWESCADLAAQTWRLLQGETADEAEPKTMLESIESSVAVRGWKLNLDVSLQRHWPNASGEAQAACIVEIEKVDATAPWTFWSVRIQPSIECRGRLCEQALDAPRAVATTIG